MFGRMYIQRKTAKVALQLLTSLCLLKAVACQILQTGSDLEASASGLLGGVGFPLKAGLGGVAGLGKFGSGGLQKGGFGKGGFGGHGLHGQGYGGAKGFGNKGLTKGFGSGGFGAGGGFHNLHGQKGVYGGTFLGGHTKAFAKEKIFSLDTALAKGAHGGLNLGFGSKGAHGGKTGYGNFGKLGAFGQGGFGHHKGGSLGAVGKGAYGAHGHGLGNYGYFGLLGKGAGLGFKALAPHAGLGFLG